MFRDSLLTFLAFVGLTGVASGQGGPATVVVAPVIEREFSARQDFVANVRARRTSVIGSAVDGRVEEFMVDAGQAVSLGQPLAQLRTKTIKIEIASAKAELALREAELRELQNGSRREEIELAEATARAANAAMDYAKSKLARATKLYRNASGLSQDEYESAEAASIAAIERAAEAESSLALVRKGPRDEKIEQAKARVEVQKETVRGLRDRMRKYTVRAPFDGFVSAESTEMGAWVQQGDAIAEVVEIDPIEVEVFVPESSVSFVKAGDKVEVKVSAAGTEPFKGAIDQLIPSADSRSRTFPVRILIKNQQRMLLPGMLAHASLPIENPHLRMLVPKDALQFGDANPTLMKVNDGKAVPIEVRQGPALGTWIAVEPVDAGSLKSGDLVVTRGNERLRPGQELVVTGKHPLLP